MTSGSQKTESERERMNGVWASEHNFVIFIALENRKSFSASIFTSRHFDCEQKATML